MSRAWACTYTAQNAMVYRARGICIYIYVCACVSVGNVGMVEDDHGSDKKCGESGSVTGPRLPDRPARDGSGRCP